MKLQILTAQREDLQSILDLQKDAYKSEAALHKEYNIPPLTQTIESINEEYDNGWLFLKAILDDELIATGRGVTIEDTSYIAKLAVKMNYQNQKIGQMMLIEIENRLSKCSRYELFTGNKSERNIYFYKKFGYSEFKRQLINERLSLIYLEKQNTK